jgi:hypothetical protein
MFKLLPLILLVAITSLPAKGENECTAGSFWSSETEDCEVCADTCSECEGSRNNCSICSNLFMAPDETGSCSFCETPDSIDTDINQLYTEDGTTCKACPAIGGCSKCWGPSKCYQCESGMFLSLENYQCYSD